MRFNARKTRNVIPIKVLCRSVCTHTHNVLDYNYNLGIIFYALPFHSSTRSFSSPRPPPWAANWILLMVLRSPWRIYDIEWQRWQRGRWDGGSASNVYVWISHVLWSCHIFYASTQRRCVWRCEIQRERDNDDDKQTKFTPFLSTSFRTCYSAQYHVSTEFNALDWQTHTMASPIESTK